MFAITLTDGIFMTISSPILYIARTGNELDGYVYESIEYGIEPDLELLHFASMIDVTALIEEHQSQ